MRYEIETRRDEVATAVLRNTALLDAWMSVRGPFMHHAFLPRFNDGQSQLDYGVRLYGRLCPNTPVLIAMIAVHYEYEVQ
jgi:hypothetical protein